MARLKQHSREPGFQIFLPDFFALLVGKQNYGN